MTVLGLKLSRRANAVSALHGEVSRAMWQCLYPGKPADAVPIGHITNGVHVPTWLAPQMLRLYDRHLGVGWQQSSGEPAIWEGIESIDDGELWETHLTLKARLIEFVRRRAKAQANGRGETHRTDAAPEPRAEPRRADDRLRAPLRHLQARKPDRSKDIERLIADGQRSASGPCSSCSPAKAHPHDEPGKRVLQEIAQLMRDPRSRASSSFVEDYDINVGRHPGAGRRRLAEQPAPAARSLRHQRPEGRARTAA